MLLGADRMSVHIFMPHAPCACLRTCPYACLTALSMPSLDEQRPSICTFVCVWTGAQVFVWMWQACGCGHLHTPSPLGYRLHVYGTTTPHGPFACPHTFACPVLMPHGSGAPSLLGRDQMLYRTWRIPPDIDDSARSTYPK